MTSEFTVAVHSMVYLYHHLGKVYSSEALAENVCTNPARIRKVLAKLKKSGLIETKEGVSGGYQVLEEGGAVTLSQIAQALQEVFVAASWKSGSPDMDCLIASGMADVLSEVFAQLNEACQERLGKITIADLDTRLFERNYKK